MDTKKTCSKEIGLCAHNLLSIPDSIGIIIGDMIGRVYIAFDDHENPQFEDA
jgi:hypothetical protein